MRIVVAAQPEDIPAWLVLAGEIEHLFGPMVNEDSFHRALRKNIARGTAYCLREAGGSPSAALCGGLLFSPKPPVYTIGWLAVAEPYRRTGIGQELVAHALEQVVRPASIRVTTFGEDHPAGEPARKFYAALGFHAAEQAPSGVDGGSRQVFRLDLSSS